MTWKLYIPNDKSDDGWVVDEAGDFVAVGLKPNRRENARLIAAAPNLLAALHDADEICQQGLNSPEPVHWEAALQDIMGLVRAAIAKAKGTDQ